MSKETTKHPDENKENLANTKNSAADSSMEDLTKKIKELEEENLKLKDALLRSRAEIENNRKMYAKELANAKDFAVSNFALETAEIMENIYRALDNFPQKFAEHEILNNIHQGFLMVQKSLYSAFEKYQIIRIFPQDEIFDHDKHQAISHVESPAHKNGQIITVVQAGYQMKSRLLRPAMVVVAKNEKDPELHNLTS